MQFVPGIAFALARMLLFVAQYVLIIDVNFLFIFFFRKPNNAAKVYIEFIIKLEKLIKTILLFFHFLNLKFF